MDGTDTLRSLLDALREPLSPADIAGGWNKKSQEAAIRIAEDAIAKIRAGQKCDAAYHFVRWLDHMGVGDGPLFEKVAEAQQSIPHV